MLRLRTVQGHLLDGLSDDKRAALLAQAEELNAQLPGGIEGYVKTARKLLQDSKDGVNPFLVSVSFLMNQ